MAKDLTGQRFGKLTVLRLYPEPYITPKGHPNRQWECQCDCGKKTIITTSRLTSKTKGSKSCGCEKGKKMVHDLTGQKFGKLTAIQYIKIDKNPNNGSTHAWLCQCECGNQVIKDTGDLKAGKIKSCGKCKRNDKRKLYYKPYKKRKSKNNIPQSTISGVAYNQNRQKWQVSQNGKYIGIFEKKEDAENKKKELLKQDANATRE